MSDTPRRIRVPGEQAHLHQLGAGRRVTENRIREIFAEARILERAKAGELTSEIVYSRPPAAGTDFPEGTLSQMKQYYDRNGKKIALTHYMLLPNGQLGASGQEDPKQVFHNGIRWYFVRNR